jgi:GxxExxY protein
MHIELNKLGMRFESQKPISVLYDNIIVGEFTADLLVEDILIVELKSVKRIVRAHEMQLVNYLTSTGKPVGLIINFGELRVDVKRKVRELNKIDLQDKK